MGAASGRVPAVARAAAFIIFFFQAEDGIRDYKVTGVQTCALPISVRQQIARDYPNDDINVTFENDTAFVRGTVRDTIAAERIMAMVATLGKSVNLLRVDVPPVETQILL